MRDSVAKADMSRMSETAKRRALGYRPRSLDGPDKAPAQGRLGDRVSDKYIKDSASYMEKEIFHILWECAKDEIPCLNNTEVTDELNHADPEQVRRATLKLQKRGLIVIENAGNNLRRRIYVHPLDKWSDWSIYKRDREWLPGDQ